jgi:hypothetical protein
LSSAPSISLAIGDDLGDPFGGLADVFVLPDPHGLPSKLVQPLICINIPGPIGFDFVSPEIGIALRPGSMLRTTMPKAAVNEDCYSGGGEDDIGDASGLRQYRHLQAITKASGVESSTKV